MEFTEYLQPVEDSSLTSKERYEKNQLGSVLDIHTSDNVPDVTTINIAIIGVCEERGNEENTGCASSPDHFRKSFYKLFKGKHALKIADLGNIHAGHKVFDTYYAVSSMCKQLIENDIIPVIIGGSKDLAYANYLAYTDIKKYVNLVSIDSHLNLDNRDETISSRNFLSKIILHQPNILFDFSNLGFQSYLVDDEEVVLMDKLNFETYRLGKVRTNLHASEPVVRNADFISFDFNVIRQSDAPANKYGSPNGLFGHEACQLSRYAGMSDKLSSIGFYELNQVYDVNDQSSMLLAQMVWYFIEGYYSRKGDFPRCSKKEYKKFVVPMKGGSSQIIFYKSHKTDRWWMETPVSDFKKNQYSESILTPCNYSDYELATNNEVPEVWLKTFNKLR